jgi:transcriptional regulator GlxA family with amidase domain
MSRRQCLSAGALAAVTFGAACAQASEPASAPAATIAPFPARTEPARVAILLDDGATVIDFAGPWEAFQDAGVANVPGFELFTVAPSAAPLRASAGLQIVPDYTLDTAPQPNVVVIPAQGGGRQVAPTTEAKIAWLRHVQANADVVMSICTGAFLLARTGLIDGLFSTTHHDFYDQFAQAFPHVHLVRGRRFVDNGKFVSGGGLTSGVDAALHIIARYYGVDAARRSAAYMEHDGEGWISGVQNVNRPI